MKEHQTLQQSLKYQSQVQLAEQVGPDDYDIDVDEVGGTSIKDLDSDVSKLKAICNR
jgi:hypothetical protein